MTGDDDRWAWIDAGQPEPDADQQLRWDHGHLIHDLPDIDNYQPTT